MKRPLFIILAVIAVFLVLAFATNLITQRSSSPLLSRDFGYGGGAATEAPATAEAPAPAVDFYAPEGVETSNTSSVQTRDRLVIENADLAIVVNDPKARMAEINALANEMGGYVVSSNLFQSFTSFGQEVPEATIVIRVPSERLDDALTRIKEGAININYENRTGQDITNIYVDLQSQLKAKQAAEAKLLEIMDQATRAEDVLAIYLQVQQVQTEIEMLKGQIQYYDESVATSAISVRLIAEEGTQPIEIGPWTPSGAAREAIQDLILFVQDFVEVLIRFVLLTLPALVLIAIPLFLIYLAGRAVYRRVRRSRMDTEEISSEDLKK
ncbi:MAG TPA: DUF4349 domain-containing protein [Anaerolineales bacterium]|nr:DUF4349 domain-containing protein [Anaerolineales bacterium]